MEEPAGRKGRERLRFPGVLGNAIVLKVKSIALQVFCEFFFFLCVYVCTIGSFQNSKPLNVNDRCFVLIFKKFTNFASQGPTGLRVCTYCCMVLFILTVQIIWKIFFPRVPFRICSAFFFWFCFVFLPWHFKHLETRDFSAFGA